MQEQREEVRHPKPGRYSITWRARDGKITNLEGRGLDLSASGIGIEITRELPVDAVVQLKAADNSVSGECFVAHCTRRGLMYHIGLEFSERAKQPNSAKPSFRSTDEETDLYDILQISPRADVETIHRVFRIMAGRFHPDNPETGDQEEFLRLKKAYDVLSNAQLRAEYDAIREEGSNNPLPIFEMKDFVTGVEAESNRRLGVLSLLYNQRRLDHDHPSVSLLDLEKRMGFPREYLSFTLWYLRAKEFVVAADNSDYALSAKGVDFVESNAAQSEMLAKLLKASNSRATTSNAPRSGVPKAEKTLRPSARYLPEATSVS